MKSILKSSKIVIMSIVMAVVVAVGGTVTAVNLLGEKGETPNGGLNGAGFESQVANAEGVTYDDYLDVTNRGGGDNTKTIITFDKYLENVNNAGSESDSDTELLGEGNRTDDQFKINCDYLTGADGERVLGIDGVFGSDEVGISPSEKQIVVDKEFNSTDKSKSVRFEVEPEKGVDFNTEIANIYYISKIAIVVSQNGEDKTLDIEGGYSEGVISYDSINASRYERTSYEYNLVVNLATFAIKFEVDDLTGKLSFEITSSSEWQADSINLEFTIKLRDKKQNNKALIEKDGSLYNLTNSSGVFSLTETDKGLFYGKEFNNPYFTGNGKNRYTVDDKLTYYLTNDTDVRNNKILKQAVVGNIEIENEEVYNYNWFTIYGGVYANGYFFFSGTVNGILVENGILEEEEKSFSNEKKYTYYKLKNPNTGDFSDRIVYKDSTSCILINKSNQCIYIKYDSAFLLRNGAQNVVLNKYSEKSDYLEFTIDATNKNTYQKFELDFYDNGKIILNQWGAEQSMSVVFSEQYYYLVEFSKKTDGVRLSAEPFDVAKVFVTADGSDVDKVDSVEFERTIADRSSGERNETFKTLFAGVGENAFTIESYIKLGVNYIFDSESAGYSQVQDSIEVVGGENKELPIIYEDKGVQTNKRSFIAMLSTENIKSITVNIQLLYDKNLSVGTPAYKQFKVEGTTVSIGANTATGTWGSLIVGDKLGSDSQFEDQTYYLKQFYLDNEVLFLKIRFGIKLSSGFRIDGGKYWYKDKGESSATEFDCSGYSISETNLEELFAGFVIEDGIVTADYSNICINFYVKPIEISQPLYVAYDSSIYENTTGFTEIDTLENALKFNIENGIISQMKVGKSGSELYKLVGHIRISSDIVEILSTQTATTVVYFKPLGESEFKKLDINNLPTKDGYAFLGIYSSMDGLSDGAYSGIGHMGNTDHNGLVDRNIIESSGVNMRYDASNNPQCYELMIDGQYFSYEEWKRQCEVFGRDEAQWETIFSKHFKVPTKERSEGAYYANALGEVCKYTKSNSLDTKLWEEYKYTLSTTKINSPTGYTYLENVVYFDKNGFSSTYEEAKCFNDNDWKTRYCYKLVESYYSYNVTDNSNQYELRLLDGGKYKFFTYSEVRGKSLESEWTKVFLNNFKKISYSEYQETYEGKSNVFCYNSTGGISKTYSGEYCYILKNENGSNEVYSGYQIDKNLVYLNKLSYYNDSLEGSYLVFYAMFDSICNEKEIEFKDYNFTGDDTLTKIHILGKGYIYTDTDFLVLEKLVGERKFYNDGTSGVTTTIHSSAISARLTYNATEYPIMSSDFALELYPISNPEYLSKNQRIAYFTTDEAHFLDNTKTNSGDTYYISDDEFKVDRKRVEGKAVYHLASLYNEKNGKTSWYVVPTELEFEFDIVSVDAEHFVKDDSGTFTKYNDYGSYTTRTYDKIKYGYSLLDLLSFANDSVPALSDIVKTSTLKYLLNGGSQGIFDNSISVITGETLRGYNLYGFIPFTVEYDDSGMDLAVEFNFELLKNYFGWEDGDLESRRNEYLNLMNDAGADYKRQFVLESVEKLDKTNYFALVARVSEKCGTNIDSLSTEQIIDAFLNQETLMGLKYVVTIEGGNQEVDAYEYNLQLVTDAIDRQVSLDILKITPFVALDKFAGSIYESGNITTFIKDSSGNIMMVNPEDGNEVIDASFVFYRNIVFMPVFVSKNANIEIDASGKILLDGNYLFVDEGKSEYSKVDGVFGEITKEVDPVDPDAPDDPEKVDINKFTATTNGILLEDEGSPDASFTINTNPFKDLLSTSVRVNKRISSVDLSKFALAPTIPSGYYISGVNAIITVGRTSQSIRLINYSLEKDGVNRKFTYSSSLNEEYFSQFFNGGVGNNYEIKDASKTEEVNELFSGILYVGENGVVYWDVFDDCKLEFVYSPFKYKTSFKTSEAVEKEFEKNNDAGALDISNVSMNIASNKSYDFLNSSIAGFLGETATIYSGGNLYVFNTITLKQLAVKDSAKLGEGKYLSNGVFVATIKVRYNTIFDEPKTEPHILGVEFVIRTDTKGIPYIVSKKIVDISYEDYNYVTDEMVDITEDVVGEALFEALDYNFATDEFIFSMEALANADNVISSVEFEFELDYKTYVLSFSAGLYKSESFDTAGKIEPKDPESITDFSTVYYLVKYNDRKWINMWIPCNKEGEPIGDAFDLNKPEMVISGSVYAFDMAESVKRFLEVTTMYDGKPRYFSFWVRDVRGVGIPAVGGGELTFEELEICHRIPDAGVESGYKEDSEGHVLWYIDNVFDSESGGSFDYYTLFVDEADINVHYYTWNSLKSTNSTNGYTITAHKGYFFGAEPESKDFFTVNAFEYYTFGGNSDERYYIVGWLKVYDNILTVLGADGKTYELSEFKYSYFNNRTENGIIVDYRTKGLLDLLDITNPYVVADSDTSGFLYGLNQQITVKKRDVVDLGVINIYMFAVYARVTYNVESTTIDGKQQYNAEIFVPNTPEMGNLEDGVVKNTYQFINYPNTSNGNASATSNVVSYWAKYTSADYEKLVGLYFDIKDMLNSGALKFTVLTDGEGKPIKNSILPEVVNSLAVGDVLVNFYCRTENIQIVTNGIEIDGSTSEIISGAKRVGTMTEDGFQFDKYVMDAQLTEDGTFIGILDNVITLDDTETDKYLENYKQSLDKLESLKTADTMGEYRLRELLARTSLQLAQWASDESHTNKFTFSVGAEDLTFDFSNGAKYEDEYNKLIGIINFITMGTEYNGSTEIKLNSASFVRLCYAITSYNLIKSSYSEEQFESLEISKIVIDMGLVFGIDDNGTTIYFTGDNTKVLSGGIYSDRVNDKPAAGDDYYDKCNDYYMVGDIIKFEVDGEEYYGIYLGSHKVENWDGSVSNPAYVVSANSSRSFNVGECTLVNMNHDLKDYIVIKQNTMGDKYKNTFSATGRTYIRVF